MHAVKRTAFITLKLQPIQSNHKSKGFLEGKIKYSGEAEGNTSAEPWPVSGTVTDRGH